MTSIGKQHYSLLMHDNNNINPISVYVSKSQTTTRSQLISHMECVWPMECWKSLGLAKAGTCSDVDAPLRQVVPNSQLGSSKGTVTKSADG